MATSWSPAWDQSGTTPRVIAAQVNVGLLDPWFEQTVLPTSATAMTAWLFEETGYVPPAPPTSAPTTGRIWPR